MTDSKPRIAMNKLREDLVGLSNYWTVLFGSSLTDDFIPGRSDIDVAVITQHRNRASNLRIWREVLGACPERYDVRVFELLPLHIQITVVRQYAVVFGDPLAISEYLYHYRRIWKDVEPRYEANQFASIAEKLRGMENRRKLLSER